VLIVGVVLAGAFLGVNNTLITETVMKVAPVERGVASAAYSFVRFSGGAVAPWLAGRLGERSLHLPFYVGAGAVVLAVVVLSTGRRFVAAIDAQPGHGAEPVDSRVEAEAVTVGDS
jgi:MFS family permease